jgi:hypothetical protein
VRTVIPRSQAISLFSRPASSPSRTSRCESPDGVGDIVGAIVLVLSRKRHLDRPEQGMIAIGLLKEVGCAGFHRANGRLNKLAELDPSEDDDKEAGPVAS